MNWGYIADFGILGFVLFLIRREKWQQAQMSVWALAFGLLFIPYVRYLEDQGHLDTIFYLGCRIVYFVGLSVLFIAYKQRG